PAHQLLYHCICMLLHFVKPLLTTGHDPLGHL
uniref:Uncharacterized protein n=1 Tax=Aegilops tauschii subsp. strangulata TaxID=200361 RepID=A0A453GNL6_AEGTS